MNATLQDRHSKEALPESLSGLARQRILITGAAGFIGGALLRRLTRFGLNCIGTTRTESEAAELRDLGYEAAKLDLASTDDWRPLLSGIGILFNIAALFQEIGNTEAKYRKVNVDGTVRLVAAAQEVGVERFVHCGTVGVHGHVKEVPCTEETAFNPMDEYHRTKLDGELAVLDYARALEDRSMILTVNRPAMVYGPGDTRMLKLFSSVLQRKFFMIGSGEVLAHLGYIDDQIDSFLLQAVAPREAIHLESFNIASGNYGSLNELVTIIAEEGGVPVPQRKLPVWPFLAAGFVCEKVCRPLGIQPPIFRRRVGFFTHQRAFDLSKAARHFGYESQWDLRKGVRATIQWYREKGWV